MIFSLLKKILQRNFPFQFWQMQLQVQATKTAFPVKYPETVEAIRQLQAKRAARHAVFETARREWVKNRELNPLEPPPEELPDEDGIFPTIKAATQISLDLDRTFYTHKMFMEKGGEGQQALFNILAVYARLNPSVGYCQGMAYVVAVLLMVMPEEEAFWASVTMFENKKFFKHFYSESLEKVQVRWLNPRLFNYFFVFCFFKKISIVNLLICFFVTFIFNYFFLSFFLSFFLLFFLPFSSADGSPVVFGTCRALSARDSDEDGFNRGASVDVLHAVVHVSCVGYLK